MSYADVLNGFLGLKLAVGNFYTDLLRYLLSVKVFSAVNLYDFVRT